MKLSFHKKNWWGGGQAIQPQVTMGATPMAPLPRALLHNPRPGIC